MQEYKNVRGSKEQSKALIVGLNTVYVHSNIKKLANTEYEYDEIQYTKDEYVELLSKQNETLGHTLALSKLSNITANQTIQQLGVTLAQTQIELMQIKSQIQKGSENQ